MHRINWCVRVSPDEVAPGEGVEEEGEGTLSSLRNGLFSRLHKIRRSGQREKRPGVRPERLKEVGGWLMAAECH